MALPAEVVVVEVTEGEVCIALHDLGEFLAGFFFQISKALRLIFILTRSAKRYLKVLKLQSPICWKCLDVRLNSDSVGMLDWDLIACLQQREIACGVNGFLLL